LDAVVTGLFYDGCLCILFAVAPYAKGGFALGENLGLMVATIIGLMAYGWFIYASRQK
jgi:hypothetical protein